MSDLERELRGLVSSYAAGQIPFARFAADFALKTWDIGDSDQGARRLTYETELLLAEYTSGHLSELDLRKEMARVLGGALEVTVDTTGVVTHRPTPSGSSNVLWSWVPTAHPSVKLVTPLRSMAANEVQHEAGHA